MNAREDTEFVIHVSAKALSHSLHLPFLKILTTDQQTPSRALEEQTKFFNVSLKNVQISMELCQEIGSLTRIFCFLHNFGLILLGLPSPETIMTRGVRSIIGLGIVKHELYQPLYQ